MIFELIAVIAAGLAGAGVGLLLGRLTAGRLPRWWVPVLAGAAMLGVAIASEYGWYPRTRAALPAGVEVAMTVEERAPYRPWTYVAPFVSRFLAVDTGAMRSHPAAPGQRIVEVYAFARWSPTRKLAVLVDCPGGRRADLGPGAGFAEGGTVSGVTWRDVGADDPVLRAACGA